MELMAPDQLWPSRGRESSGGGGGTGCLELGRLRGAVPEKSPLSHFNRGRLHSFFLAWSLNYVVDDDWLETLLQHLLFCFMPWCRPSQENKCFHLGYCRHLKEQFVPNCKTFLKLVLFSIPQQCRCSLVGKLSCSRYGRLFFLKISPSISAVQAAVSLRCRAPKKIKKKASWMNKFQLSPHWLPVSDYTNPVTCALTP